MDNVQFLIFITSFVGLFIWNRTESRADCRHMDAKLESSRNMILAIHEEVCDFHKRLGEVEIKRRTRKVK